MRTLRTTIRTLALILSLTALAACGQGGSGGDSEGSGSNDGTTSNASGTSGAPRTTRSTGSGVQTQVAGLGPVISFARLNHDFGEVTDTEIYSTTYEFTNTGGQTLVIDQVKASCGCTLPKLSKYRFEPGETGEISVDFDPKAMKDAKTKKVTVISNASNSVGGVNEVTFTVQIKPLLRLDTRFLRLGKMTYRRENRGTLGLTYWDQNLQITSVECNEPFLKASVVDAGTQQRDGSFRAQVQVTVADDAPWGSLYSAKLFVKVNGRPFPGAEPIDYDYEAYVQGSIFGELRAESSSRGRSPSETSMMSLGPLSPGGSINSSIRIFSPREMGFNVVDVQIADSPLPGLQTRIEQLSPASWRVHLTGPVGNYVGNIRGMLHVRTDVAGEEVLPVRFVGAVR
jgi:hypothetical protein